VGGVTDAKYCGVERLAVRWSRAAHAASAHSTSRGFSTGALEVLNLGI